MGVSFFLGGGSVFQPPHNGWVGIGVPPPPPSPHMVRLCPPRALLCRWSHNPLLAGGRGGGEG